MAKVLGFTINIQGTEAAIENATDLRLAIQEINKQLKDPALTKPQYDKLEKQLVDLKARQKEVNAQVRDSITRRRAEFKAAEDSTGAYRQLSAQLTASRARMKDLAAAGRENTAEFKKVSAEVNRLDTRLKKIDASAGQFQRNVGNYSSALKGAFASITKTLSFAGIALGAQEITRAFKESVQVFADFSRQINFLGAVSGATEEELAALEAQAKSLGETTQFSASQVAQLQIEYSKLGFTAQETLAATADTLNLASVAQSDLGETATVVGATLRAFNLDATETGRVTDVAAKAFSSSALDLQKFATAMASVAPVAAGFGVSIEETSALLGVLVDAGLDASTAGTGLRNVLLDSAAAGLTYEQALEQVANATDSNLEALDLFGKRGATVGTVLANNRDRIAALNETLENSAGFAKQAGDAITNDLQGDFDGFRSAVEGLQLRLIDFFDGALRKITQFATGIVRSIGPALEFISKLLEPVREAFNKLFDSLRIGEAGTDRLSAVFTFLGNALGFVVDTFAFAIDTVATFIGVIRDATQSNTLFGRAFQFVNKVISDTIRNLADIPAFLGGIVNAVKRFRENVVNLDFSNSIKDAFFEGFNRVRDASRPGGEIAKTGEETGKNIGKSVVKAYAPEIKEVSKLTKKEIEEAEKIAKAAAERARLQKPLDVLPDQETIEQGVQRITDGLNLANQEALSLERRNQEAIKTLRQEGFERADKQRQENFKKQLAAEEQQQRAIEEARQEIINTSLGEGFALISLFQQRATERATAALDTQIEAQEASIQRLEEQAAQTSGIQREILQNRIAQEKATLQAQAQERERIQTEQAKKEKRLSIVQSIIQTALSVVRALANPPGPPFSIPQAVAAGIAGAAQTAIIAAQPLATGGLITGRRVTDRQNIPRQGNGDNVLATVRRGEVVLNSRQQAALGGAATFRAIGVPGFAAGGVISPPISAPTLPVAQASRNPELLQILKQLDAKTDAINRRVDRLRAIVVSEDVADDLQDGNTIRVQATFE